MAWRVRRRAKGHAKPAVPRFRGDHPLASRVVELFAFPQGRATAPGLKRGLVLTKQAGTDSSVGDSASFDGSTYYSVPFVPPTGLMAILVRFRDTGSFGRSICGWNNNATASSGIYERILFSGSGFGELRFIIHDGTSAHEIDSATVTSDSTWHSAAGVIDGAQRIYIDGTLRGTPFSPNVNGYNGYGTPHFLVGRSEIPGSGLFTGQIGQIVIVDGLVTPAEVAEYYADPFALVRPRRYFPTGFVAGAPPAASLDLAGVLGPTGAASLTATVPAATLALAGSLGLTGAAALQTGAKLALAGVLGPTAAATFQGGNTIALAGVLGPTAAASFTTTVPAATVQLAGVLTPAGSAAFQTGANVALAGVLGPTAAAAFTTTVPAATVSLAGVLPLAAAATFAAAPPGGATIQLAGVLTPAATASLAATLPTAQLALAGVLGPIGSAALAAVGPAASVALAGVLTPAASAAFSAAPPGGASIQLAGVLFPAAAAQFTATAPAASVALAGVLTFTATATLDAQGPASIALAGVLNLSGQASFVTTGGPLTFLKSDRPRFDRALRARPAFRVSFRGAHST